MKKSKAEKEFNVSCFVGPGEEAEWAQGQHDCQQLLWGFFSSHTMYSIKFLAKSLFSIYTILFPYHAVLSTVNSES
jgi:hypothetical protein